MDELNRFFMPPGLCIKYTTRCAAVHNVLQQIGHYMDANLACAYPPYFYPRQRMIIRQIKSTTRTTYKSRGRVRGRGVDMDDVDYDEGVDHACDK